MEGCIHNAVLYWPRTPITSTVGKTGGYVVGWDETCYYSRCPTNFEDCSTHGSQTDHGLPKQYASICRTTICAGIIPAEKFDLAQVQLALDHLKKINHLCTFKRKKTDSKNACSNCPPTIGSWCCCFPCACYGSFGIVAFWSASNGYQSSHTRENRVEETPDGIPLIVPTIHGPWWSEISKADCNTDGPLSKIQGQRQLILFDRCGGGGTLDHYKSFYSISRLGPMERTLQRINEAGTITEELFRLINVTGVVQLPDWLKERQSRDVSVAGKRTQKTFSKDTEGARWRGEAARLSLTYSHFCRRRSSLLSVFPMKVLLEILLSLYSEKCNAYTSFQKVNIPRYVLCQSYISTNGDFSRATSAFLDSLLGTILGFVLILEAPFFLQILGQSWDVLHNDMLRKGIAWLETFPIGFKLNVPLTRNMGREINLLIENHGKFTSLLLTPSVQRACWLLMSLTGIVFGLSCFLAAAFDMLRLCTFHLALIGTVFRKLHRGQLSAMSSLWHLFRGKKRNVLRHRSDSLEYDYMQLLLGVILFTIVLFLFTTILVYYAFFTVVDLAAFGLFGILWSLYVAINEFPLGKLFLRYFRPDWFVVDIAFHFLPRDEAKKVWQNILAQIGSPAEVPMDESCVYQEHVTGTALLSRQRYSIASLLAEIYRPTVKLFLSNFFSQLCGIPFGKDRSLVGICLDASVRLR